MQITIWGTVRAPSKWVGIKQSTMHLSIAGRLVCPPAIKQRHCRKNSQRKCYIHILLPFFAAWLVYISIVKGCLVLASFVWWEWVPCLLMTSLPLHLLPDSRRCAKKVLPVRTSERMANTFFVSLMPHSTNYYNFSVADKNQAREHRKTITL